MFILVGCCRHWFYCLLVHFKLRAVLIFVRKLKINRCDTVIKSNSNPSYIFFFTRFVSHVSSAISFLSSRLCHGGRVLLFQENKNSTPYLICYPSVLYSLSKLPSVGAILLFCFVTLETWKHKFLRNLTSYLSPWSVIVHDSFLKHFILGELQIKSW